MTKLNLESFNSILFDALNDDSPKGRIELLEMELQMAYAMKVEMMETIMKDLNEGRRYQNHLQTVNNINASCDELARQIDAIYGQHPELKESEDNRNE